MYAESAQQTTMVHLINTGTAAPRVGELLGTKKFIHRT
jgi:hypothetical protein